MALQTKNLSSATLVTKELRNALILGLNSKNTLSSEELRKGKTVD